MAANDRPPAKSSQGSDANDSVARSRATHRAIEAVFRIERARIIAVLTRFVRDVGLAEEFAQDALISALRSWPETGVPDKPGAWLITAARRRAIDHFRRTGRLLRSSNAPRH